MTKRSTAGRVIFGGLVGGLVGTWVMSALRTALLPPGQPAEWSKREHELRARGDGPDDVTEKVANNAAKLVLNRNLSKQEKRVAGPLVHYATGVTAALCYAPLCELAPPLDKTFGLVLGVGMWLGDETILPALGLSPAPQQTSLSAHLYNLASHLTYGLVTDAARRIITR